MGSVYFKSCKLIHSRMPLFHFMENYTLMNDIQILQHEFWFYFYSKKQLPERRYLIFVALERWLNVSMGSEHSPRSDRVTNIAVLLSLGASLPLPAATQNYLIFSTIWSYKSKSQCSCFVKCVQFKQLGVLHSQEEFLNADSSDTGSYLLHASATSW